MRSKEIGFTLLELVVTMAIVAIVVAAAVPSFTTTAANSRGFAMANDYFNTLSVARGQAVTLSTTVTVCNLDASNNCSSNWQNGVTAFIDSDNNGKFNGTDKKLREVDAIEDRDKVIANNSGRIVFNPEGMVSGTGITITVCPNKKGDQGREVIVAISGRIKIQSWRDVTAINC
ncbi:GspH/FimT family pseudopilin [Corallincola spongiicola]|uniref:Type II secretion system protein H n=1 Tax=Corallincola spongiicola TaxID=2520508 RepID=A0ABY1WLT0_9GAMM|nr:GspH/FimT family pseudopilin [Corallincola spongiicola]TAA41872.1 prepilin-type N-terminal cleavage/methylation domain-containing protein [Corallincola spongiicola]